MNRVINGFPNYTISSNGEIRKLDRAIKQHTTKNGYKYVDLSSNGTRKRFYVHRLVALHFVVGIGDVVNHKDCNKTNNCYTNLEWCNTSYNTKHAYDNGLIVKKKVTDKVNSELMYHMYINGTSMLDISKELLIGITSVSKYINIYVKENNLLHEFNTAKSLARSKANYKRKL